MHIVLCQGLLLSLCTACANSEAPGCEIPVDPPDGKFYLDYNNTVVTLVCREGYRQMGDRVRYCDGVSWDGVEPHCKDNYPSRSVRQQQEENITVTTLSPEKLAAKQLEQDVLDADNTCYVSNLAPLALSNATSRIQYKYNSVRRQWIMIVNYSCSDGFRLANKYASYTYCKDYNWTARIQPACVEDVLEKNPCEAPNKGGCEQVCVYHGGTSYSCLCNEGFSQRDNYFGCDDINECRLGNGGCEQLCHNLPGTYFCSCEEGFIVSGSRCVDVDECVSEITNRCHGDCINVPGSYNCNCTTPGYRTSDDKTTCVDVDECAENSHDCKDVCVNYMGSFECACSGKGYKLSQDGKTCEDVDECRSQGRRKCQFGKCRNVIGSYECICEKGFVQSKTKRRCKDVNECKIDNGGCSAICVNMAGNFSCKCHDGYYLDDDGKTCIDKDECSTGEANCSEICTNTAGSYRCGCSQPFQVLDDDKITCKYCNHTQFFDHENLTCNNCPPDSHTMNIRVSSANECLCDQGFQKFGDECVDYDECQTNMFACEQLCVNTAGSAHCECHAGFKLIQNRVNCTDIDECEMGIDNCDHLCINADGGYSCECRLGYELGFDDHSCIDIDECYEGYLKCSHVCVNTESSAYCSCPSGYRLQKDNSSCADVDECLEGTSVCEDVCINREGSYSCECSGLGFKLSWDLASCSDINECMEGVNYCEDICINTHGSYRCTCSQEAFQLAENGHSCKDVDECRSNTTNECQHICINTIGHYQCDCLPGYTQVSFSKCSACGQGTYRRQEDPECVRCPKYSVTDGVAKTDITDCICLPGFQGNVTTGDDCKRIQ